MFHRPDEKMEIEMEKGFVSKIPQPKQCCIICGCEIPYLDARALIKDDDMVCRSFSCRRVLSQKSSMSPLMFQSLVAFNRTQVEQQQKKQAIRQQHINNVRAREEAEEILIRLRVNTLFPELEPENTHQLTIPSGGDELTKVSDERKYAYIEHLVSIIEQANEYNDVTEITRNEHSEAYTKRLSMENDFALNDGLQAISDKLCTMCKGGCCASGKEHAYLSVFSMRRYMDEHSEETSQSILTQYLSCLKPESIENSCINHTLTGCSLPRELRSDICNSFYCESLKAYQHTAIESESIPAVVATRRESSYWSRFEPGVENAIIQIKLIKDEEEIELDISDIKVDL